MRWEKINRAYNNFYFSGGIARLADTAQFDVEIDKRAAAGTLSAMRNRTLYGKDNSPRASSAVPTSTASLCDWRNARFCT
jgi:hypothetical protein